MSEEKIAPVQGYSAGIPWPMHLRAYDAYCKEWGPQQAMIDLEGRNCRGGFSTGELDMFIPGWRDELSETTKLKQKIAELESLLAATAHALRRLTVENIPDEWPGECVLTLNEQYIHDDPTAVMTYLSAKIKGNGTIADHRAAAEVLRRVEE